MELFGLGWGKWRYWDLLDIGESGRETQRDDLTLEAVIRVQHKDQSEQI